MTNQETYDYVKNFLREHKTAVVTFTKKDGSLRELFGTLEPNMLPELVGGSSREPDYDTFTIFDIETEGWRSFKTANFVSIKNV